MGDGVRQGTGRRTVVVLADGRWSPSHSSGSQAAAAGSRCVVFGAGDRVVPLVGQSAQSRWRSGQGRLGHQSGMPQKKKILDTKHDGRKRQKRKEEDWGTGLRFWGLFFLDGCAAFLLLSAHAKSYWKRIWGGSGSSQEPGG